MKDKFRPKRKTGRVWGGIVGFLAIFAVPLVAGGISLIFDPSAISTVGFWANAAGWQVCTFGGYSLMRTLIHDKNVHSPEYLEKDNILKEMAFRSKEDMKGFLAFFNRRTKIQAYRKVQERKKEFYLKRIEGIKEKGEGHFLIAKNRLRRIRKLDRKVKIVDSKLTEEYIEAKIDYIHVNYEYISKNKLFTGNGKDGEESLLIADIDKIYAKSSTKKFVKGMFIAAGLAMVGGSGYLGLTSDTIYNLSMAFLGLAWSSFNGGKLAYEVFKNSIVPNQANRASIFKEYGVWSKQASNMDMKDIAKTVEAKRTILDLKKGDKNGKA